MYSTIKDKHRWFLTIGLLFSISLLIFSFTNQSHADPNFKHFADNDYKVYIEFPATWTVTDQPNTMLFTGDGASLEIGAYYPTTGGFFPSTITPIEQIANNMIKEFQNIPNIHLDSQGPIMISDIPAYQMRYSNNQQGEVTLTDQFILISGDYLYQISLSAPESIYEQNIPTRDHILSTIAVGNTYDTEIVPYLNNIKYAENYHDKILNDIQTFGSIGGHENAMKQAEAIGDIVSPHCDSNIYNNIPSC